MNISTRYSHASPLVPDHTIVPIVPQPARHPTSATPPPLPPNLPLAGLLEGPTEEYNKVVVPLYEAATKGDWKTAKPILDNKPELVRFAINRNYETLLHVAASAECTKAVEEFVKNLVDMMSKEDLELPNKNYDTALSLAAAAGSTEIAKAMVEKNPDLIKIPGKDRRMPLYMAALFAKPDMVRYLYGVSNKMAGDCWSLDARGWVLKRCVEGDIFDVALKIVNDLPDLTSDKWLLTDLLLSLAQNAPAFKRWKPHIIFRIINPVFAQFHVKKIGPNEKESEALQLLRIIWEKVVTMPPGDIDYIIRGRPVKGVFKAKGVFNAKGVNKATCYSGCKSVFSGNPENKTISYPSRVLFIAAKMGNTRFIIELIRLYPDLIWNQDDKERTIFHLAVKHQQAEIFKLLYEIRGIKDLVTVMRDKQDNNMLHMAAKSAKLNKQNVSGVALQMQQQLIWFKEVERIIPPRYKLRKNKAGETPHDLFNKKHEPLMIKGEEWMRNTSSQCMVVATLIATIVFAAAFTLPGGYDQNTGIPFFRKEPALITFVISDAVSLISSSTSVLIFLSILTSRYAEHDFLESLPKKLMYGLAMLFLSIVTMMVAFSASFFVLYNQKLEWVPITITCLASIPVILYAILQFRLLGDVFESTYRSRNLFKHKKQHILLKPL